MDKKIVIRKKSRAAVALTVMLLLATLLSSGVVFAQEGDPPLEPELTPEPEGEAPQAPLPSGGPQVERGGDISTAISTQAVYSLIWPVGKIYATRPKYQWVDDFSVNGQYQVQVYQGTTRVLNVKKHWSEFCDNLGLCAYKPAKTLAYAQHKWRVRGWIGLPPNGYWGPWTPFTYFTVAKLPAGFNSTFTSSYTGWSKNPGAAWKLYSGGYLGTAGAQDKFSSVRYKTRYEDFDYSARMRRYGGILPIGGGGYAYPDQGLNVRMGTSFTAWYDWYPGYYFSYWDFGTQPGDGGYWTIYAMDSGGLNYIDGGYSALINKNSWNTLRVNARGSTFKFYINGTLHAIINDTWRSKGLVGIGMWRFNGTSTKLKVDWAKLKPLVPLMTAAGETEADEAVYQPSTEDLAAIEALYDFHIDPETSRMILTPK